MQIAPKMPRNCVCRSKVGKVRGKLDFPDSQQGKLRLRHEGEPVRITFGKWQSFGIMSDLF